MPTFANKFVYNEKQACRLPNILFVTVYLFSLVDCGVLTSLTTI